MKRLRSRILAGNYVFDYAINTEMEESWDEFTNTCRIELPNSFRAANKTIIVGDNNVFQRGDEIQVHLGYHPNTINSNRSPRRTGR